MKTTIDIPAEDLKEAMRHTGAKSKQDAVVIALKEFNKKRRLAALAGVLGTFEDFMMIEDLDAIREDSTLVP